MVKIPKHIELRSWLIDGEIQQNPHDVPGFIDELYEFTVRIPAPDVTREIEVRKRLSFPIWSARQQVCKLLEVVHTVYGYSFSENEIDSITNFASYYSREESLYIPENIDSEILSRSNRGVISTGISAVWHDLRSKFVFFLLSVADMSDEINVELLIQSLRKKGSSVFACLSLEIIKRNGVDLPVKIYIKMHRPGLDILVDHPEDYAINEYETRIHETTHLLALKDFIPFLGPDKCIPSLSEFYAQAFQNFTLGLNGLPTSASDSELDGSSYEKNTQLGIMAALDALKKPNQIEAFRANLSNFQG